ncbi:hypothetical protein FJZ55_10135, partial [Candidatus Woesearchaeota archaeon]|nr:hypothetical protein [Candidatus Woesearchaeota archaeon]
MATQKTLLSSDKKTTKSFLNQLIDVLQEDIRAASSRRKYQVFVTGGIGPGVTSSLFQTVYDQDFTLQTANAIFDVTFGIAPPDVNATGIASKIPGANADTTGKCLYPSNTMMMREKTDIYSQFSQTLLGDRKTMFELPEGSGTKTVDAALFIAFKRLFSRDQIKRETFAMRFFQTASYVNKNVSATNRDVPPVNSDEGITNIFKPSNLGEHIYTDIGSSDERLSTAGGSYGYLVDASLTTKKVGLIWYERGIAVLDILKITSGSQFISGTIGGMYTPGGTTTLGSSINGGNPAAKLVPDLLVSGSVDDVIDHFCYSRFGDTDGSTAITFQNITNINSSLIFCRALPDDFNYSSNPTYYEQSGDTQGRLTIYDKSISDELQEPFSYITTIGLHDSAGKVIAV